VKKNYFFLLLFYFLSAALTVSAQAGKSDPCKGGHDVKPVFGGVAGGEINIREHLNDSLYFTDDCVNKDFVIVSFHLALKSNGNVLKYLENKNGNQLTEEMKSAVLDLLPGCTLTFDGIKTQCRPKDFRIKRNEFDFLMLKFTLVQ
jgi:hypothetical protein